MNMVILQKTIRETIMITLVEMVIQVVVRKFTPSINLQQNMTNMLMKLIKSEKCLVMMAIERIQCPSLYFSPIRIYL